ncbi:MAG: murein hydrolase activator EnvC family protein [Gemmatimonadales bacterium]
MKRALGLALPLTAHLALTAAPATAQAVNVERRIRQNQQRLEAIKRERSELQQELERLRNRAHTLQGELDNLERQKTVTNRIVNELDRQLLSLSEQIDTATLDLVLTQDAHAEKRAVLRRRLVEIYKRGPLWTFQVLLSAESFGDLLSRYKYLYLVSRQDRALVREIEELRDRIADQRRQLLSLRTAVTRRRDERGDELTRYRQLERERQLSLRQAQASQQVTASRLDSLALAEQTLNDILAALERERRRALAAGRVELGEASISTSDLGALDWPVDGGEVLYNWGRAQGPDNTRIRYEGIGIAVPVGTPVKAVADGVVDLARPLETWGPAVIVRHGGGFYTVYAYLSRLEVIEGQFVSRGTRLGLSGGAATWENAPHIEFQIRQSRDGLPITLDPLNWLKRRR